MSASTSFTRSSRLGHAWILQCAASAVHMWDAGVHDFLSYYNATVLTLYGHFSYFPRLDVESKHWREFPVLLGLLFFALTPLAYRNLCWVRFLAYGFSALGSLIAIGHILVTIHGGTVPSVRFAGTSPGFYSSPFLLVSSLNLLWSLHASAQRDNGKSEVDILG